MARIQDFFSGDNLEIKDDAASPDIIISLNPGSEIVELPHTDFVKNADILRDGHDLVLKAPDGTVLVVEGYFAQWAPPVLAGPEGHALTPGLVKSFVTQAGDAQYAQSATMNDASPVGAVNEVSGTVTVTRADGSVETVTLGTRIFKGDIIETDAEGAVNIYFIDDTSFAVSQDARLAIDEFVYNPQTQSGTQKFSVLRGLFAFTSGLIGRDNPDEVTLDTPMGSIGIRGTVIIGNADTGEITVLEGAIVLKSHSGNELTLADQFDTAKFDPATGDITFMGQMSADQFNQNFASLQAVSPSLFSAANDTAASGNDGGASASDAAGQDADNGNGDAGASGESEQSDAALPPSSTDSSFAGDSSATGGLGGETSSSSDGGSGTGSSSTSTTGDVTEAPSSGGTAGATDPDSSLYHDEVRDDDTGGLGGGGGDTLSVPQNDLITLIDQYQNGFVVNSLAVASTSAGAADIIYTLGTGSPYVFFAHLGDIFTPITFFSQQDIDAGQIVLGLSLADYYEINNAAPALGTLGVTFDVTDGTDNLSVTQNIAFGETGLGSITLAAGRSGFAADGTTTFEINGGNATAYGSNGGNGFNFAAVNGATAYGGSGDDDFTVAAGADANTIYTGNGNNTVMLNGDKTTVTLGGGDNVVTISATSFDNIISGGTGSNEYYIHGSQNNISGGGESSFYITGTANTVTGNGTFQIDGLDNNVSGGTGDDTFQIMTTNLGLNSVFDGGAGHDELLLDFDTGVINLRNVDLISIEEISFAGTGQSAQLNISQVLDLIDGGNELRISSDGIDGALTLYNDVYGVGGDTFASLFDEMEFHFEGEADNFLIYEHQNGGTLYISQDVIAQVA